MISSESFQPQTKWMWALGVIFTAIVAAIYIVNIRDSRLQFTGTLYTDPIVIGTETWPGYIALYVAEEQGYFRDEGLDVAIRRYTSLKQLSEDFTSGVIQGRANLTLDTVSEFYSGFDPQIVLVIDYSVGADAIMAEDTIRSANDLVDKRVAYERGTLEEFFLSFYLRQHQLSLRDVQAIEATPERAAKMLKRGEVDAAVSHEPYISQYFDQSSSIKPLFSSRDSPGLITDVLTFSREFVDANPDTIRALVRAYFKGLKFVRDYPLISHMILAEKYGIPRSVVGQQMSGVRLLDIHDNRSALGTAFFRGSLDPHLEMIDSFVRSHRHIVRQTASPSLLIQRQFVDRDEK